MPPKPSSRIPLSEIAKLEHLIDQEPARAPSDVSKRQAVAMLPPKLYEMRRKGYAWRDVAVWLSGNGLTMSAAALQRHLRYVKDPGVRGRPRGRAEGPGDGKPGARGHLLQPPRRLLLRRVRCRGSLRPPDRRPSSRRQATLSRRRALRASARERTADPYDGSRGGRSESTAAVHAHSTRRVQAGAFVRTGSGDGRSPALALYRWTGIRRRAGGHAKAR